MLLLYAGMKPDFCVCFSGLLENNERLLVPSLELLREGLLMGEKTFVTITLKSQLLTYLAKVNINTIIIYRFVCKH